MKKLFIFFLFVSNVIFSQNNETTLQGAVDLYGSGDLETAINWLKELEKTDKENLNKILYFKGLCFLELEKYPEALKIFDKNLKLYSNSLISNLGKGQYFFKKENYDKAIVQFTKVIEIDENYESAYFYRAESYYNLDDNEKAIVDYTNAINLNKNDPEYYLGRCICYRNTDNTEKSCEDYKKAIELDSTIAERIVLEFCE